MRLLLDTHVFLWYVTADPRIRAEVREAIRDPANSVYLSVVSLWEVIIKHQLGKMPLPAPPDTYIPRQRQLHRIENLDLREAGVASLANLPPLHRDPFGPDARGAGDPPRPDACHGGRGGPVVPGQQHGRGMTRSGQTGTDCRERRPGRSSTTRASSASTRLRGRMTTGLVRALTRLWDRESDADWRRRLVFLEAAG